MRISKFSKVALVFVCVALVVSAALILAPTFSNKSDVPADAAITAASSFDKFSNGIKYYYTNPTANSQTTVTVNSSSAWGSQTNPYVINNTAQWILFVNKINANDSNFLSKSFVLGADLDFANNPISPVGSNSNGFQGVLYGNKHIIKRAKINSVTYAASSADKDVGLFAYLNGASVYDLIIDSSNVYSYAENQAYYAGTLAGRAKNATITNVVSKANITVNNNGITTTNKYLHVGGLVGYEAGSAIKIYKSTYQGTITVTPWATTLTAGIGNDCHVVGGLVGSGSSALTSVVIANCYANMHAVFHGGGVNIAGVVGRLNSLNAVVNMTDCVVVTNYTLDGVSTSPDIATIANLGTTGTLPTSCVFRNIYITWNSSTTPKVELVPGWNGAGSEAATSRSGIVTNLSSITSATVNSNPMSAAAGNSGITTYYTISGSTATSKLNVAGNINYDLGGVQDCKQS